MATLSKVFQKCLADLEASPVGLVGVGHRSRRRKWSLRIKPITYSGIQCSPDLEVQIDGCRVRPRGCCGVCDSGRVCGGGCWKVLESRGWRGNLAGFVVEGSRAMTQNLKSRPIAAGSRPPTRTAGPPQTQRLLHPPRQTSNAFRPFFFFDCTSRLHSRYRTSFLYLDPILKIPQSLTDWITTIPLPAHCSRYTARKAIKTLQGGERENKN